MEEMSKNLGEVPMTEKDKENPYLKAEDSARDILETSRKRLAEILEERKSLEVDPVNNKEKLDILEIEAATTRQNVKNWEKSLEGKENVEA